MGQQIWSLVQKPAAVRPGMAGSRVSVSTAVFIPDHSKPMFWKEGLESVSIDSSLPCLTHALQIIFEIDVEKSAATSCCHRNAIFIGYPWHLRESILGAARD